MCAGVNPGISHVASDLGVAERTLQRRLGSEGTSYNAILNGTRRSVAERLLRRRELSIAEIAHALGFGDVPSFHRAFVRWTGVTPGKFCKDQTGSSALRSLAMRIRPLPSGWVTKSSP